MPTAKARYIGDGKPWKPKEFSEGLRQKIRGYFPDLHASSCPDQFTETVLSAAGNAAADARQPADLAKQEIRAERDDIVKTAEALQQKLRHASLSLRCLLPPEFELLGHVESIAQVIQVFDAAADEIRRLPQKPRPREAQHVIAVDMAIRVLAVLKDYGIAIPTTPGTAEILKAIGDDIGLVFSELTWRDIISKAKAQSPDLR